MNHALIELSRGVAVVAVVVACSVGASKPVPFLTSPCLALALTYLVMLFCVLVFSFVLFQSAADTPMSHDEKDALRQHGLKTSALGEHCPTWLKKFAAMQVNMLGSKAEVHRGKGRETNGGREGGRKSLERAPAGGSPLLPYHSWVVVNINICNTCYEDRKGMGSKGLLRETDLTCPVSSSPPMI